MKAIVQGQTEYANKMFPDSLAASGTDGEQ